MKSFNFRHITYAIIPLIFVACSTKSVEPEGTLANFSSNNQYLKSGTISVAFDLPTNLLSDSSRLNSSRDLAFLTENNFEKNAFGASYSCDISSELQSSALAYSDAPKNIDHTKDKLNFAPLVGFFPLSIQFKPADNEIWIQLVREKNQIEVYKGQEVLKVIPAEGAIKLAAGEYPLQHKQRNPLWYAPDEYFSRRELRVPPRGDHFRYRRGALGNYALYPTMDFVIHSGPFWSEEVGGLKVSEADLAAIFVMMNVGTPIIVK